MSPFRPDVQQSVTVGYSVYGKAYTLKGIPFPGSIENRTYSTKFWALTEKLFAEGKLKAHPVRVVPGGLAAIFEGLKEQKEWKVSAEKLVYLIGESSLLRKVQTKLC